MKTIDINCDMGESYGPWPMGNDERMMPLISSANIACGAHAGDPDVMLATVRLARQHGVAVGAHPGYMDLRGFGRHPLNLSADEIMALLLYQLGALWAICRSEGMSISHVKPHGALYNQACASAPLAQNVVRAIQTFSRELAIFGLPGSQLERAADEVGMKFVAEGFADRAYEPDGSLRNRKFSDALITNNSDAAQQATRLASGDVIAVDGSNLHLGIHTICIHGDTPGASDIASAVRRALENAGYKIEAPFGSLQSGD